MKTIQDMKIELNKESERPKKTQTEIKLEIKKIWGVKQKPQR